MRELENAWLTWWKSLGHVARTNRDKARIREAFEAGFLAASALEKRNDASVQSPSRSSDRSMACEARDDDH